MTGGVNFVAETHVDWSIKIPLVEIKVMRSVKQECCEITHEACEFHND